MQAFLVQRGWLEEGGVFSFVICSQNKIQFIVFVLILQRFLFFIKERIGVNVYFIFVFCQVGYVWLVVKSQEEKVIFYKVVEGRYFGFWGFWQVSFVFGYRRWCENRRKAVVGRGLGILGLRGVQFLGSLVIFSSRCFRTDFEEFCVLVQSSFTWVFLGGVVSVMIFKVGQLGDVVRFFFRFQEVGLVGWERGVFRGKGRESFWLYL